MTLRTWYWIVWSLSAALAVAWLIEATTTGRGFISKYLAPVAIVGIFVSMYLRKRSTPSKPV